MFLEIRRLIHSGWALAVLLLTACIPVPGNYTIGGTVTGLVGVGLAGSVVLQNNGGDNLVVSTNGSFSFATQVHGCSPVGSSGNCGIYSVSVLTQPLGQTCTVTNGSGTATSNVTNVLVNCTNINTSPRYAYVANAGDGTISQYTISSDGTLIAMTPGAIAAGTAPHSVTVDPSGKHAYVANSGSNRITQYTIGTDGTLTLMATASVATGTTPYSIAIDPSGQYAYVANEGSNNVSQYTIGSGGTLTAMTPATVAAGTNPCSVTIAAGTSGQSYVYVANSNSSATGSSTVSQYIIGAGGALTVMSPATVVAGTNPVSITTALGQYAYVANYGSGTVSQYSIGTGGGLTAMTVATVAAGTSPYSATVDPASQYVYVTNEGGYNVSQYTIGSGGALIPIASATTVAAGANPISVITAQ